MNIDELLKNPTLINNLSISDKTNLYFKLVSIKTDLTNKIAEQKAKKELLEKQKAEIQQSLFEMANVDDMDKLVNYTKQLQEEFNTLLQQEALNIADLKNKLSI